MTYDAPFYVSVIALLLEILLSINNARISKSGEKISPFYGIVPAVGFLTFHISWWMSAFRLDTSCFWIYLFGTIASVAFLFGSSFVTTGCLTIEKGALVINKDNNFFKLFSILPIKFEGKSLCEISWLAAILIFIIPILASVLGAFCAVATVVICLWTAQNPIAYFIELIGLEGWPETNIRRNSKGWIISPMPWITPVLLVYLFVTKVMPHIIFQSAFLVPAFLSLLILVVFYFGINWIAGRIWKNYSELPDEDKSSLSRETRNAISRIDEDEKSTRFIYVWSVFWQIFRHKFCPKIEYREGDVNHRGSWMDL